MGLNDKKVISKNDNEKPFSHLIDQFDNGIDKKYAAFNETQAMYNLYKKKDGKLENVE